MAVDKMLITQYLKHKEIIHDISWRALQIFGKQGILFLIFFLCAKMLSPYDFGIYNYIMSIISILIIFGDFGVSTATSKYIVEYNVADNEKSKSVLISSGIITISLAVIISTVVIFFGESYFDEKYTYIIYLLPLVYLAPIVSLYDGIYRGLRKFKQLAIVSSYIGIISIIFVYILIKQYGLIGALIAQNLIYFIIAIALAFGYREFSLKINKNVMKEIGKYSLVIGMGSIGLILYSRIDIVFLGHYGFIEVISYYEIMNKILMICLTPFLIIGQVISPNITQHFVNKDYESIRNKFKKYFAISFIFSFLIVIFFFYTSDYFISNFLKEYNVDGMYLISNLMLIVYFTQILNSIIPIGFVNATGHAKLSTDFLILFGVIHVILNFMFINWFGYIGIIYSTVITKCVADLLFIYMYSKILRELK